MEVVMMICWELKYVSAIPSTLDKIHSERQKSEYTMLNISILDAFCNNANNVKGQEKIEGFRLNDIQLLSALLFPDFK